MKLNNYVVTLVKNPINLNTEFVFTFEIHSTIMAESLKIIHLQH
jgi:hypothetical protein